MEKLSDCVGSTSDLHCYLKQKGKNHSYYKFYTSKSVVDAIMKSHSIFLSKGERWNDIQDRMNFNTDEDTVIRFGLCMSYAKSENVAMWMLYGKTDGLLIDFGRKLITQCLNQMQIECGRITANGFEKRMSLKKPDFSTEIIDIVYYGESKEDADTYYIKRSDEAVQNCDKKVINGLRYCKKTTPWQYECECRLIVSIKKTVKRIDSCDTVKLSFDESSMDILKRRVFHSPNYEGICEYEKSKLTGRIQWKI